MKAIYCVVGCLFLFCSLAVVAEQTGATAKASGTKLVAGRHPGHLGHRFEEKNIAFSSGKAKYTVKYYACADEGMHPGRRFYSEGYIGMPSPTACNWYHSGFLFVAINDGEVGIYPLMAMDVLQAKGGQAMAQMVWDTPDANVTVIFAMKEDDDMLRCRVLWQPRNGRKINSVQIKTVCYPSYFTHANRRNGDRFVTTPAQHGKQGKELALDMQKDNFLLYGDNVFDTGKGEGQGPCAMAFLPGAFSKGSVSITGYPVTTILAAHPEAGKADLMFWEFKDKTNADALQSIMGRKEALASDMASYGFEATAFMEIIPKAELDKIIAEAGPASSHAAKIRSSYAELCNRKARLEKGDRMAYNNLTQLLSDFDGLLYYLKIEALINGG